MRIPILLAIASLPLFTCVSVTEARGTTPEKAVIQQSGKVVEGVITDSQGEALPGVIVSIKGTKISTITDIDGKYRLTNVPAGAKIEAKLIGMKTAELSVGSQSHINFQLEDSKTFTDEVVVVGYAVQRKVDVTGAVSNVKIDEQLNSRSMANPSLALQGKIPGLSVTQNTGLAGDNGVELLIRGMGTVNDASPLIVVDGMPDVSLSRLNLDDVESISVLKDAASAAVYGSRAANGVILITTKSGSVDSKAKINASISYTLGKPTNAWEYMTDYARTMSLHNRNASTNTLPVNFRFKNGTIDEWLSRSMNDPFLYPSTDWYDVVLRDYGLTKYNVSAQGGVKDKSNYYISFGAINEDGMVMDNNYKQYNARLNYEAHIRKNLIVGARFAGNWSNQKYGTEGSYSSIIDARMMRYAVPGITPYDPVSGEYGGIMADGENSQAFNPYSIYNNQLTHTNRQEANGSMRIEWKAFKGFSASAELALNYYNQFRWKSDIPNDGYNFQTGMVTRSYVASDAGVENYTTTGFKTQFTGRLSYDFTLAKQHKFTLLGAYSREYWYNRNQTSTSGDKIYDSLSEIDATLKDPNRISVAGNSNREGLISYIGRVNYSAFGRYLFEFTVRCDGSSKFTSGHKYGTFPSGSIGWFFTEEPFMKKIVPKWLSMGKLRFSYGELGNNSGVGKYEQLELLTAANYYIDNTIQKGLVNKKMVNRNFSWEETKVTNIGLDMRFFDGRLGMELDYYNRLTTGMHRPSDLSLLLSGAYTAPRVNVGELRNRGIEGNFSWRDKVRDFSYSLALNASYNLTRLEKWNEYLGRNQYDDGGNYLIFIDMPYAYLSAYEAIGIAQSWEDIYNATPQGAKPGDILYKDLNGDGRIDSNDMRVYKNVQQDRPTANFALNTSFQWRGFDLALMFQGTAGRKTFYQTVNNSSNLSNEGRSAVTSDQYYNTWTLENRNASLPRMGGNNNNLHSTFFLNNLAYLRLKNLQIGYRFQDKWVKMVGLNSFRVYFSTDNLFTITSFDGLDPEKTNVNDGYPLTRSFTFGLNIEL